MADNAKMHFNIGLILATLEDHERAVRKKKPSWIGVQCET